MSSPSSASGARLMSGVPALELCLSACCLSVCIRSRRTSYLSSKKQLLPSPLQALSAETNTRDASRLATVHGRLPAVSRPRRLMRHWQQYSARSPSPVSGPEAEGNNCRARQPGGSRTRWTLAGPSATSRHRTIKRFFVATAAAQSSSTPEGAQSSPRQPHGCLPGQQPACL